MNKQNVTQAEKDLKNYGYKPTQDGGLKKDNHVVKVSDSGKSLHDNGGNTYSTNRDVRNGARKD